ASSPSLPSPTTSTSGAEARIIRSPDLTRSSSSTRSARITVRVPFLGVGPVRGNDSAHPPPAVGAGSGREGSAGQGDAFTQPGQTVAAAGWWAERCRCRCRGVGDLDLQTVGAVVQVHGHRRADSVFGDVGQAFLDHPVSGALGRFGHGGFLVTGLVAVQVHTSTTPLL